MPIYKAAILRQLIDEKNLKISEFEALLGYSNGGLAKAMEDNSKLKQERVDRLFSIYPNLSKEWLQTGKPPMFTEPERPIDTTTLILEIIKEMREDRKLVTQEFNHDREIIAQNQIMISKAAQDASAAAQSATKIADMLTLRFEHFEQNFQAANTMLQGVQEFVVDRFAKNENTSRQEIRAALGKKVLEIDKKRKKDTQTAKDTLNTLIS